MNTKEGKAAVREAIAFLENQPPVHPLKWHEDLAHAARDMAEMQGPTGAVGHAGPDGSTVYDRISKYT